jgi:uncharacterized protein (TIGR04255 family)
MDTSPTQTLPKNRIKNFILRFDFQEPASSHFVSLIGLLAPLFDRVEKRSSANIHIELKGADISKAQSVQQIDHVLISEKRSLTLNFSEVQNAILLTTNSYISRTTYQEVVRAIIAALKGLQNVNLNAKRIGLRFVNEFPCDTLSGIAKILEPQYVTGLRNMLRKVRWTPSVGQRIEENKLS